MATINFMCIYKYNPPKKFKRGGGGARRAGAGSAFVSAVRDIFVIWGISKPDDQCQALTLNVDYFIN